MFTVITSVVSFRHLPSDFETSSVSGIAPAALVTLCTTTAVGMDDVHRLMTFCVEPFDYVLR